MRALYAKLLEAKSRMSVSLNRYGFSRLLNRPHLFR